MISHLSRLRTLDRLKSGSHDMKPRTDPAFNHRLLWREIADRPNDPDAAWAVLYAIVDQHVGRLKELLARNEAIEAAEDSDWAARAGLDCSPAFERHRRCQSARHRELLRTLETLRKTRNAECGMGKQEWRRADARWQMTDARWQMTNARWQMTNARWQMTNARWQMTNARWRRASSRRRVGAMKGRTASR